jgi:hypothetical protein
MLPILRAIFQTEQRPRDFVRWRPRTGSFALVESQYRAKEVLAAIMLGERPVDELR